MRLLKKNKLIIVAFLFLVILLNFASLHKALSFGFWRDDWLYVWGLKVLKDPHFFNDLNIGVSYPLDLYRLVFLSEFLSKNPLGWQVSNIVFRILATITSAFFVYSATESKKTAFLSGLLIAVGIGGVEPASFLGANNVTFFIIPLTIGLSLWIISLRKRDLKIYLLSVLIFGLCAKGEVWSYYLIPLIAIVWDLLYLWGNRSRANFKFVLLRILGLVVFLILISPLPPNPNWFQRNNGLNKLGGVKPSSIKNLLASLGNLILGSFYYISESAGVSSVHRSSVIAGAMAIAGFGFLSLYFIFKPNKYKMVFLYFLFWMLIFYGPNWIFDQTLVVGASHRYLTISSIGLYSMIALGLSLVSRRLAFVLAAIFIFLNVYISNRVLAGLSTFRSEKIVSSVIGDMNKGIKSDQEDVIIYYGGEGTIRGYILDWSLGIPIAMERNISDRTKFPIWTGSDKVVNDLLCGKKVTVNLVGKGETYERGGYKIPLDRLYDFYIKDDGQVIDYSNAKRNLFNATKDCVR